MFQKHLSFSGVFIVQGFTHELWLALSFRVYIAPDIEKIILFCNKHIGWAPDDTKRFLEPVIQSRNSKKGLRQTRIDSFMRYEDGIKFADVRSKRLRDVLGIKDKNSDNRNKD